MHRLRTQALLENPTWQRGNADVIAVGRPRGAGAFSTHNMAEPKFFFMYGSHSPERVTHKHMGCKARKQHGKRKAWAMVVHIYNPSTWESRLGESGVQSYP